MHLLPCPSCQDSISITPTQAGSEIACPSCQATVTVPRLGDIRSLPRVDDLPPPTVAGPAAENTFLRQLGTGFFGLVAVAALLIAGFCAVRWHLVEVTMTTPQHIELLKKEYAAADAAQMIREYEDMEKNSIDLPSKFTYKTTVLEKQKWGSNALIAGVTTLICGLIAMVLASTGRRAKS